MWTDETRIRHDRIRDTLDGAFLADMREAQLADQFGHLRGRGADKRHCGPS